MDNKFKDFKKELNRVYRKNKIYKEKMQEQDITPEAINSWEDIKKLPLTTKQDLLKDYPNGWNCVPPSKIKMYHSSSGTTGKPLIVGLTEKDIEFRKEIIKADAKKAGITSEDTVEICYGFGMFIGGFSFYEGLKDLGCKIIPTGTMSTEMQLFYMQKLQATVLLSSPSHIMHLYEKAKELKIDVKKLPIRIIRVGSELLTETMRKKIKESWGENVNVTQDYGMTETLGPGLGMECIYENGMHLNPNYYFELIDPITKLPTENEIGELVVTTIYNECFPIIRYATNDLVKLSKEKCPCGSTSPRIVKFLGRTDDMLKVKGVKIFVSQIEDFLFMHPYFNHQYEIVISKEEYKDILTINIEYKEDLINVPKEKIASYKIEVEQEFKNKFGITSQINIVDNKTIKPYPGKIIRVRDLRKLKISN